MRRATSGFTIVELLIVIVVIAILAAISVVAYTGIQNRSKDSIIKSQASQFAKALTNWGTLTGRTAPSGGYGSTQPLGTDGSCPDGSSVGWVAQATYTCTLEEELAYHKLLPPDFVRSLPGNAHMGNSSGLYTLMIYPCVSANNTWAILYYLNSPSPEEVSRYTTLISECPDGNLSHRRTTYGMQGAIVIAL